MRVEGLAVWVVRALVRAAGFSAASERVVRALGVDAWDFAAAERVAGLLAVRVERAVSALAVVLRAVAADVRFVPRALAADFVVRVAAVRAVVARVVRAGAFRVAVAVGPWRVVRAVAVRPDAARVVVRPAARLVAGAAFARVVRFGAAAFAEAAALVVRAGVRAVFARVVDALVARVVVARVVVARVVGVLVLAARTGAFAVRVLFAAGLAGLVDFADLAPGFLAAADRVDTVAPVRVVRAVVLRVLEAAVRRPPARTAMARVRLPSVVSLLMIETLCLVEMVAGCEDHRPICAATSERRASRSVHATDMQHARSSCSGRAFIFERIDRQNADNANRRPMTHDRIRSSSNRVVLSTKSNRYTKVP